MRYYPDRTADPFPAFYVNSFGPPYHRNLAVGFKIESVMNKRMQLSFGF